MALLDCRVVDRGRWGDLEALFGGRGGPSHCWCTVWRTGDKRTKESRHALLCDRVEQGEQVGLLGYVEERPVAWCSVGPRPTYRRLGGVVYDGVDEERVWSIVCFFVHRDHRGQGAQTEMLEAALDLAGDRGAWVVEAYPVLPDSPSYRFMGFVETFERAGFEHRGRAGTRRHVMSRWLAQ
jgi:GNAT superfamily N-acetyltransferase